MPAEESQINLFVSLPRNRGEGFFVRAIIFANGEMKDLPDIREVTGSDHLVIAADGGSYHCERLGIRPQVIIGDFDSLEASDLQAMEMAGVKTIRYPTRKDYTDMELALLYARDQGIQEIQVYGALGQRWDQTLANLLLPASEEFDSVQIRLIDHHQEITLLRSGHSLGLSGQPGDTVSLVPLMGDAQGITTQGLEYPLQDETLYFGSTRGISNVLLGESARVSLREGLLLCITIHDPGR